MLSIEGVLALDPPRRAQRRPKLRRPPPEHSAPDSRPLPEIPQGRTPGWFPRGGRRRWRRPRRRFGPSARSRRRLPTRTKVSAPRAWSSSMAMTAEGPPMPVEHTLTFSPSSSPGPGGKLPGWKPPGPDAQSAGRWIRSGLDRRAEYSSGHIAGAALNMELNFSRLHRMRLLLSLLECDLIISNFPLPLQVGQSLPCFVTFCCCNFSLTPLNELSQDSGRRE